MLTKVGLVTLLLGIAGVVLAGFAGWGVARNGLKPVRRLTGAVETIARTERLTPIPVEGDDEIARLSSAFNQMLAALDASRDRQRRLVADAGHELRTPLTSLRTNIDLLSQATAADDDPHALRLPPSRAQELMDDVRAQTEELTTLIGDLVELARDEPLTHVVGTVDLAELVEHAVARVRRRAPGVAFEVETESWEVVGESGTLERAVTNLLDNAAKWSPPGGTVRVAPAPTATLVGRRRGPRHRRARPPARLRALLPRRRVPLHARLRARPGDRGAGRRAALRHGARRGVDVRRGAAGAASCPAAHRGARPLGSRAWTSPSSPATATPWCRPRWR